MAWGKAGSTTLSSTGDDIDITSMTASKFNTALMHIFPSGSTGHRKRFGSGSIDTGSNYAERVSLNGASDVTYTSQDRNTGDGQSAGDRFQVEYGINIATEEKLFIYFDVNATVTGAGTAPKREEYVAKWVNTSNQYDQRRSYNALSGSYNTDSNISALGSDLTPSAGKPTNVQAGSRYEETDTRKMYHYKHDKISIDGNYTVLKFTENGTFTPTSSFNVEYLVVAGGGAGGGYYFGGGAGAGGYRTNGSGATSGGGGSAEATYGVTAQNYTITVGAGGVGIGSGASNGIGTSGGNSSIVPTSGTSIISTGGGYGGWTPTAGASGGSGGGSDGYNNGGAGSGTSGQGYAGGAGASSSANYGSGGGGGAGGVGNVGKTTGSGAGGVGVSSSISGTATYYAGGGGGGSNGTTGGSGGNGGGGAGAVSDGAVGTAGTTNTGGGGGGVSNNSGGAANGGNGGSGIVIIRFLTSGNTYTSSLINTWEELGT
jgi:hypothetical protein